MMKYYRMAKGYLKKLAGYSPISISQPLREWLLSMQIRTVFDVGAHKGETARWYRQALPDAHIYSFEPQKDCFDNLLDNMRGDANFRAFNFALGDTHTKSSYYRSNYTPSSSLLEMDELHKKVHPHTAESHPGETEIRRLDDIVKEINTQPDFLLKLDTQGYEYHVLKGAQQTLHQTTIVISEVLFQPLYKGQAYFEDVFSLLTEHNFRFKGAWAQGRKSPINGLPMYADLLFVKESRVGQSS